MGIVYLIDGGDGRVTRKVPDEPSGEDIIASAKVAQCDGDVNSGAFGSKRCRARGEGVVAKLGGVDVGGSAAARSGVGHDGDRRETGACQGAAVRRAGGGEEGAEEQQEAEAGEDGLHGDVGWGWVREMVETVETVEMVDGLY